MVSKSPVIPKIPLVPEPGRMEGVRLLQRSFLKTKPPKMYQVVMFNDELHADGICGVVIQEFFLQ